jgi:hypothetical protein
LDELKISLEKLKHQSLLQTIEIKDGRDYYRMHRLLQEDLISRNTTGSGKKELLENLLDRLNGIMPIGMLLKNAYWL